MKPRAGPYKPTDQSWPDSVEACHGLLASCCAQHEYLLSALEAAQQAIQRLETAQHRSHGSKVQEHLELKEFVRAQQQKSIAHVAQSLMQPHALRHEFIRLKDSLPLLYERLRQDKWNSHDEKMSKLPPGKARHTWERRFDRTMHRLLISTLRARNSRLLFCLPLARSIVLEHQHIPYRASDYLTHEQANYDSKVVARAALALKDWIPVTPFETSDELVLVAMDNLDMYCKKGHTRLKDGMVVTSHMLHAVVSERILFDRGILIGSPPTTDLLSRDTELVVKHAALPNKDTVHQFLRGKWSKYMNQASTCTSPTDMLTRPDAHFDKHTSGRTICQSLPILTGRSTASKVDVAAAIKSVKDIYPGAKLVLLMDYQTFAVTWWLKARTPDLYKSVIPVGGELHRQFHSDDCVYRIWWDYVLEPAAMWLFRSDIRQPFNADTYNNKEKFVRLVASAGLIWLSRIRASDDTLSIDPVELMTQCEKNLPVWEFISFLLYAGTFALSDKEAMRVSDVVELDFAWGYTSILARACHKTNYAKYGVLMNLVLHNSHQWVRAILDKNRTYRSSDLPCTSIGMEAAIEHSVRSHKSATQIPSERRLLAANLAMTAKREISRDYDEYYDMPTRGMSKQLVLDEDIEALVEVFSFSFGATFAELQEAQTWSKFANRGIIKADCGASHLENVWDGIGGWVQSLTTSCNGRAPMIFEPPEFEPDVMELVLEEGHNVGGDNGLGYHNSDAEVDGAHVVGKSNDATATVDGTNGYGQQPWHKRAARAWLKTHGGDGGTEDQTKQRLEQIELTLQRSSRRQHLFERGACALLEEESRVEELATQQQERQEELEAAAAEVEWAVEEIVNKREYEGVNQYRVKWLGYSSAHNSWEPAANLSGSEMLIAKFEEKYKSCKTARVSIHQYTQTGRRRKKRGRA